MIRSTAPLFVACLVSLGAAGPAFAQIVTTNDDSAALAPAASHPLPVSMGINMSFGGQIGRGVTFAWDSDVLGRLSLDVLGGACQGLGGDDTTVVYIDSRPGGFASTVPLSDTTNIYTAAATGVGTSMGTADLTFAPSFGADYALVFRNTDPAGVQPAAAFIYELRSGALTLVATPTVRQDPAAGCAVFHIGDFLASDIGVGGPGDSFKWFATLINASNAFRSDEYQGTTVPDGAFGPIPVFLDMGDYNLFRTVGPILVNEIDADTPGPDTEEFVELIGPPGTRLDGTVVTFFNGSSDTSYRAEDLDGETLGASGYYVLGAAGVPNVDRVMPDSTIQNGADAVAFYLGDGADFPSGTPVTALSAELVDAVVYDTSDADDPGLLSALLLPGMPQVDENSRGNKDRDSSSRCPDGSGGARATSTFSQGPPTPGAANDCSVCGDGTVQGGESCDEGAANGTATSCCAADCTFRPSGEVCGVASGDCDISDVCNDVGVCLVRVRPAGTICRAAAGPCDAEESCDGTSTACPADARMAAGTVCRAAASACDAVESCNGSDVSCPADTSLPDGTPCDNAMVCDGAEVCVAGVCTAGAPPSCDDGDLCTADSCVEPGGCAHSPVAGCCNIDADCDDGDVCTADVCSGPGGTCSSSPISGCCVADADCDDGNACTADSCDATTNRCTRSSIPGCCAVDADCDDGNVCTTDSCDATTGSCTNDAIAGCCLTDGDCNDADTCTMDVCDPSSHTCTNDAIAGCCTVDADCDDGDPCTLDRCDGGTGGCTHDPVSGCGVDGGMGGADGGMGGADGGMGGADGGMGGADGGMGGADGGSDAGTADAAIPDGSPDAMAGDAGDGGVSGGGCGCTVPGESPAPGFVTMVLFGLALRRRRR